MVNVRYVPLAHNMMVRMYDGNWSGKRMCMPTPCAARWAPKSFRAEKFFALQIHSHSYWFASIYGMSARVCVTLYLFPFD